LQGMVDQMHRFEISEFNINYGFKNREHLELLKKQILAGAKLDIVCYEDNGVLKIIDGGHAYVALQELGIDPFESAMVTVMKFETDADKIAYSRHRNINRLQRTPVTYTRSIFQELKLRFGVGTDEEVKRILRRLYNINQQPERYNQTEEDKRNVTFIDQVFETETIDWISFVRNNLAYLDFPLWLAEMVDRGELSAAQGSILNQKKLIEVLDEEMRRRVAELVKGKSVEDTKNGVEELLRFEPPLYNVWNFTGCNPLFGTEYPGRIPGQIVQRVLYLYTEEGDLVVDPMAGGGTTKDVCHLMNRVCLAYDINPQRGGIIKHDVRNGFPEEARDCDLVFLDPPYWRLEKEFYGDGSVSALSYEDWLGFMKKLAISTAKTVRKGGHVALLLTPFYDEKVTGRFLDLPFICSDYFLEAGLTQIQRVSVPMPSEIKSVQDVEYAKKNRLLLDLNRDLITFRRN